MLLLSIIDLVERGVVTSHRIELSDALIRMFKSNANRMIGHSVIFRLNIGQPFYHMQFEPFWQLRPKRVEMHPAVAAETRGDYGPKKVPYSIKGLRENYECAIIDKELFDLLQNEDVRAKLRTALISQYLAPQPNSISPLATLPLLLTLSFIA